MDTGFRCANRFKILTDEEVLRIHEATLDVLTNCGLKFVDREAMDLLGQMGCEIDRDKMMVRFPPRVIENMLKTRPQSFVLKGRNGHELIFSGTEVYFANHSANQIIDPDTGHTRVPNLEDVGRLVSLIDALSTYHACFIPAIDLADKPAQISAEWITAEMFRKTEKPTIGVAFGGAAEWIVRMAEVVGEKLMGCISPVPPLFCHEEMTQGIRTYAAAGHPISHNTGIVPGATGPATLAGALVAANAEVLSAMVFTQAVNPGNGMFYSTQLMPMDMRTGRLASGAVEAGLLCAAAAQMAHFYAIPYRAIFPMTDANSPDQQCGYEKTIHLMLCVMAGANYIVSGGGVEDECLLNFDQLVIDDEVHGMVGRMLEGIRVDRETLCVDLIKEVGPIPGTYLNKRHTKDWWKKENYLPRLSSRLAHQAWQDQGAKTVLDRARERVNSILNTHQPKPLPEDQDRELEAILKSAERKKLGL